MSRKPNGERKLTPAERQAIFRARENEEKQKLRLGMEEIIKLNDVKEIHNVALRALNIEWMSLENA